MKVQIIKVVSLIVVLGGLAFMQKVSAQEMAGGGRLTGTWDTTVTIRNCDTGNPILIPFASIGTFNQGGTYVGITAGTSPAKRSPELGVWRHIGDNRYQFRFKTFHVLSGDQVTHYDVVTHEIELAKDNLHYTSAGTSTRYTIAGDMVFSGCSTAVGTRMTLD